MQSDFVRHTRLIAALDNTSNQPPEAAPRLLVTIDTEEEGQRIVLTTTQLTTCVVCHTFKNSVTGTVFSQLFLTTGQISRRNSTLELVKVKHK